MMRPLFIILPAILILLGLLICRAGGEESTSLPAQRAFQPPSAWQYSPPLISPERRGANASVAQKDPSIVYHDGRWHVFMTVKLDGATPMEYCCFDKWENADKAPRTLLKLADSTYFCAPQVFYFAPQKKWYMIYQVGVKNPEHKNRKGMWVAYSTTSDIADPNSWTKAQPILDGEENDPRQEGGLDYWIICDDQKAYLFLTADNGKMWRLWTPLADFPRGFHDCQLALQGDIFEASHTYKLKGLDKYLTIIESGEEAKGANRRYYRAFLADKLDGAWTAMSDQPEKSFASWANIHPAPGVAAWTDNISHGELIRDSNDQTLTVDPEHLQFVFQGMLEADKAGKPYGKYPWRIGILTPATAPAR